MKTVLLLCSIVSAIVCLWALPSWAQGAAKTPWLAANRFTVTAGVGQFYESASTQSLTTTVPKNVGFALAQYTIAGGFSVLGQWQRSLNGARTDRAFVAVGFTLPIGAEDR
jgi:hypothetical protein